jgi:four helix bundle protein
MRHPNYKEFQFYCSARKLIPLLYQFTSTFPKEEQGFTGIVNQIRRAGISVCSNIAEGSSRKKKEFYHFLSLSLGSLREIETQIAISFDLGYISDKEFELINEIIDVTISKLCAYMRVIGKDAYNNKNQFL